MRASCLTSAWYWTSDMESSGPSSSSGISSSFSSDKSLSLPLSSSISLESRAKETFATREQCKCPEEEVLRETSGMDERRIGEGDVGQEIVANCPTPHVLQKGVIWVGRSGCGLSQELPKGMVWVEELFGTEAWGIGESNKGLTRSVGLFPMWAGMISMS